MDKLFKKKIIEIDQNTYDVVGPYDITLCTGENCRSKNSCLRFLLNKTGGRVFVQPPENITIKCDIYLSSDEK